MGLFSKKPKFTEQEKMLNAKKAVDMAIPYVDSFLLALPSDGSRTKAKIESIVTIVFSCLCVEKVENVSAACEGLPQAINAALINKPSDDEAKSVSFCYDLLLFFRDRVGAAFQKHENPIKAIDEYLFKTCKLNVDQAFLNDFHYTINDMIRKNGLERFLPYILPTSPRREPEYRRFGFTEDGKRQEFLILIHRKYGNGGALYLVRTSEPYDVIILAYVYDDEGKPQYYDPTPEEMKPFIGEFMMIEPQYFRKK